MDEIGIKDTIAYKIVLQIKSHVYPDEKFTEDDFLKVYFIYNNMGGSWQSLINGDPKYFSLISKILKKFMRMRAKSNKYSNE